MTNLLCDFHGLGQVAHGRFVIACGKARQAAQTARTSHLLAHVAGPRQRHQRVDVLNTLLAVSRHERRLCKRFHAAQRQPCLVFLLGVPLGLLQGFSIERNTGSQLCDCQIGLEPGQPVLDSGTPRERQAGLEMLRRCLGPVQLQHQAAQCVVRHHLVADQSQNLQPRQRFVEVGPCVAIPAQRQQHVGTSNQRRTQMPLKIGGARNGKRSIEMRQRAGVVGQSHVAGAGPADHHQVLCLVTLVLDCPCQQE